MTKGLVSTLAHLCYSDIFRYDPLTWCGPVLVPVTGLLEEISFFSCLVQFIFVTQLIPHADSIQMHSSHTHVRTHPCRH